MLSKDFFVEVYNEFKGDTRGLIELYKSFTVPQLEEIAKAQAIQVKNLSIQQQHYSTLNEVPLLKEKYLPLNFVLDNKDYLIVLCKNCKEIKTGYYYDFATKKRRKDYCGCETKNLDIRDRKNLILLFLKGRLDVLDFEENWSIGIDKNNEVVKIDFALFKKNEKVPTVLIEYINEKKEIYGKETFAKSLYPNVLFLEIEDEKNRIKMKRKIDKLLNNVIKEKFSKNTLFSMI